MEKLKTYFFCGLPRRAMPIAMPILIVSARFALASLDERCSFVFPRLCCNTKLGTAILNLNICDNRNINHSFCPAESSSAQYGHCSSQLPGEENLKADANNIISTEKCV